MSHHHTDIPLLTAPFLRYIPTNSQELDFHLPSRTPLHGLTVAEWAGQKSKRSQQAIHSNADLTSNNPNNNSNNNNDNDNSNNNSNSNSNSNTPTSLSTCLSSTTTAVNNNKPIVLKESTEDNWKDVYRNIKCMDQLYDASFYSWLKSEENVLVTAMYLHRIANEYPLVRIINALKWLIGDWRLESISTLVRHVTVDWCDEAGDLRRAHLLRHLTHSWATQYTTTLITMVLSSAPYTTACSFQRERFLRAFTKEWDFSKLSEFFMYLQSPANIDYKVKCVMLQEAARRERETLGAKLRKKRVVLAVDEMNQEGDKAGKGTSTTGISATTTTSTTNISANEDSSTNTPRRHHRRTSSNDVNDIKRLRLSTPDLDHNNNNSTDINNNSDSNMNNNLNNTRRSASPDHHPLRCLTTNSNNMSNELSHLHIGSESSTRRRVVEDDPMDISASSSTTTTSNGYDGSSSGSSSGSGSGGNSSGSNSSSRKQQSTSSMFNKGTSTATVTTATTTTTED